MPSSFAIFTRLTTSPNPLSPIIPILLPSILKPIPAPPIFLINALRLVPLAFAAFDALTRSFTLIPSSSAFITSFKSTPSSAILMPIPPPALLNTLCICPPFLPETALAPSPIKVPYKSLKLTPSSFALLSNASTPCALTPSFLALLSRSFTSFSLNPSSFPSSIAFFSASISSTLLLISLDIPPKKLPLFPPFASLF